MTVLRTLEAKGPTSETLWHTPSQRVPLSSVSDVQSHRLHEPAHIRIDPRRYAPASLHNVSPLTNQESPKAHSANDSSQNTGLMAAMAVFFRSR